MRVHLRTFPGALLALSVLAANHALAQAPAPAAPVVLMDVRVETDDPLPVEALRRLWPWEPGLEVSRERLAARMGLVEELPFVDRLDWSLEPVPGGDVLVMRITGRRVVREVELSGLGEVWRPIFEPTAVGALRLRVGDGFDPELLDGDVKRLEELFRSRGFFDVRCEAGIDEGPGTVAIRHSCERGPSFTFGPIDVRFVAPEGADERSTGPFSAEEVADALLPWYRPAYYRKDDLEERVEELLEDYRDEGWVTAKLSIRELEPRSEASEVDLVVELDVGRELVVSFEGNTELDADDLEEVLPFRPERSDGTFLVSDGADAILRAYELEGFPDASVRSSRDVEGGQVLVRYEIDEGPGRELLDVTVEGVSALDPEQVADVMAADANRWLVLDPVWDRERLAADRAAIRSLYRARGYADVEVSEPRRVEVPKPEGEEGPDDLRAVFTVTEGERIALAGVAARGVPEELAEAVERITAAAAEAEVYRATDVKRWSQSIATTLHDAGYLNAVVATRSTREGATERLDFDVTPGPRFVTGPIFLLGNYRTDDDVLRAALEVEEGETLLPDDLAASQKQVRSLDVFESIRLTPVGINGTPGAGSTGIYRAPMALVLRERPRMELGAGVRYDTDRGFGGTASFRHNNLLGRALHLSVEGELGERDLGGRIALTDPRLLGTSVRGTVSASYADRDLEAFDEEEFLSGVRLARDLTDEWTVAFDVTYRFSDITDVAAPEDPQSPEEGISRALLWTPSVTYDSRDSPLSPTRGMLTSLAVALSNTGVVSDDDFVRIDYQQRNYWTIFDDWVAVLAVSFTDVELYGDTLVVPSPELLFAGGGTTVRGFEEDRIGPLSERGAPLGGGTRVVANAELRFPLYLPLEGAVFLDSGSVVPEISELDVGSFQTAAGAGLRLRSPVGPVRVDFGYQLEDNPPLDRWRIHFSFGYPF